jgi:lipopolysaccharide export LptBFGC system permease protein LptF
LISKLDKHLIIEIFVLTSIITASITSVMFMFRLLGYSEYIFVSSEGLFSILMFVVFLLPAIFKLTIPISLLLATLIVFQRLSNDRELEAWLSVGVSPLRMARGPMFMGLLVASITLFSALYLEPFSRREWRKFKWMHAKKSVEMILENKIREKTFISELFRTGDSDIGFYVERLSEAKNTFEGVFLTIKSKQDKHTFVLTAEQGTLVKTSNRGVSDFILQLKNGTFYYPQTENKIQDSQNLTDVVYTTVSFEKSSYSLISLFQAQFDPGSFNSDDTRSLYPLEYWNSLKEMRQKPDWEKNAKGIRDHSFFYEQLVVPFACILLPLLGMCLGIQDPRRKPGMAYLGLGVVMFLTYATIMVSQQLALKLVASPEITLILSPICMTTVTLLCLRWRTLFPPGTLFREYILLSIRSLRGT